MSEICREKTLIDESVKKRLIDKCELLMKENDENRRCLSNSNRYACIADNRIQALEQTIANMCVREFGKSTWQYDEKGETE